MEKIILLFIINTMFSVASNANPQASKMDTCFKKYEKQKADSPPAAIFRAMNSGAKDCVRKAMNEELDKILLPLKKSNPAKFKQAMADQKKFNDYAKKIQDTWNEYYINCCSTCGFEEASEELMTFFKWRSTHLFENDSAVWEKIAGLPSTTCDSDR